MKTTKVKTISKPKKTSAAGKPIKQKECCSRHLCTEWRRDSWKSQGNLLWTYLPRWTWNSWNWLAWSRTNTKGIVIFQR